MPFRIPLVAKRASAAATARSQAATSWQPAAVAMPWTEAITGWGASCTASINFSQVRKIVRSSSSVRPTSSFRSWPAEKARPAPLMTMTETSSRAPWRSSSAISSRISATESALSLSGRLSVMIAAGSASSTTRCSSATAIKAESR